MVILILFKFVTFVTFSIKNFHISQINYLIKVENRYIYIYITHQYDAQQRNCDYVEKTIKQKYI